MFPHATYADQRGFTLVEVMVAVLIMTIGLLALLQTVGVSLEYNRSNKFRNDAITFADDAVGTAKASAFNSVITSTVSKTNKSGLGFVNYSVANTVTSLTGNSLATNQISGAKRLLVTVSWREKGARKTHSISTTIIETAN